MDDQTLKLSDLDPNDVQPVADGSGTGQPPDQTLKLSDLDPKDIQFVASSEGEAKSTGMVQTPMAAVESFNRQRSLGLSDVAQTVGNLTLGQLKDAYETGGLSKILQTASTSPEAQAIQGRINENPVTGFLAGTLGAISTGGFGIQGAATKALGKGFVADMLGHMGVGSAFGLGNAVSEGALGDPQLNGERVLAHLGMGAAIGGGVGLFSKALGALPAMLRRAPNGIEGAPAPGPLSPENSLSEAGLGKSEMPLTQAEQMTQYGAPSGPTTLRDSIPLEAINPADQAKLVEGLNDLKPSADEIIAAGRKLGAVTPEGMLTNSDHVQKVDHALINSPSPTGIARSQLYNQGYQQAAKAVSGALGEGTESSLAQTGDQVKKVVSDAVEARYAPIKALYDQIRKITPDVSVSDEAGSASKAIGSLIKENGLIKGTPEYGFVKTFEDGMADIQDVNQLANFKTAVNRAAEDNKPVQYVAGLIQDKADELQFSSIKRAIDQTQDPAQKAALSQLGDQLKEARSSYAEFKGETNRVGKLLWGKGGSRSFGPQDFLNKIEEETPERFATRLFAKNNVRAVQWLQQEFPDAIDLLSNLEKSKIRKDSLVKGDFSAPKALKIVFDDAKIPPEIRDIMFNPEEQSTLKAGKVYMDNLLPNFNPSGTASASVYQEFIKHPIDSMLNWAKDFGIGKYIEHDVNLSPAQRAEMAKQAEKVVKLKAIYGITNKIGDAVNNGVQSALKHNGAHAGFLSGANMLADKVYDHTVEKINNYSANPQSFIDDMANNTEHLNHAAPNITQAINATTAKGVSFLKSKIPQAGMTMPLSATWQPSITQKAKFSRYYNAVNEPLKALKDVRNGSLSPETMEALQTVYPSLLGEMRQKMMEHMDIAKVKTLPYNQRLGLSTFLGQPLDGNMTPQGIMANQASFSAPQLSKQNAPSTGMRNRSSLGGLKQLKFGERASTRDTEEA